MLGQMTRQTQAQLAGCSGAGAGSGAVGSIGPSPPPSKFVLAAAAKPLPIVPSSLLVDSQRLTELQRLITVLIRDESPALLEMQQEAHEVKIQGDCDFGGLSFPCSCAASTENMQDEDKARADNNTKTSSSEAPVMGGAARDAKTQRNDPPPTKVVRLVNTGQTPIAVMPLAIYPHTHTNFSVTIRRSSLDGGPTTIDELAQTGRPVVVEAAEHLELELTPRVPKVTGIQYVTQWVVFHINRGVLSETDDISSQLRPVTRHFSDLTLHSFLLGFCAKAYWLPASVQTRLGLNKLARAFIPPALKNIFASLSGVAVHKLKGVHHPVPACFQDFGHVSGMTKDFFRDFRAFTLVGSEVKLSVVRSRLFSQCSSSTTAKLELEKILLETEGLLMRNVFENPPRVMEAINGPLLKKRHQLQLALSHRCYQMWNALLDLEELQMQVDICEYDIFNTKLKFLSSNFAEINVPGASEHRPACTYGTIVYIRRAQDPRHELHAVIVERKQNKVRLVLPFAGAEQRHSDELVHVRFEYPNRNLLMMRRAIEKILKVDPAEYASFLWPCPCGVKRYPTWVQEVRDTKSAAEKKDATPTIPVYAAHRVSGPHFLLASSSRTNQAGRKADKLSDSAKVFINQGHKKKLRGVWRWRSLVSLPFVFAQRPFVHPNLNSEQKLAVNSLLAPIHRCDAEIPFLLTGPAGTGKTLVVVETVLQALASGRRIAVCAPSDSAADVLASRLRPFLSPFDATPDTKVQTPNGQGQPWGTMFRYNSHTRMQNEVTPDVLRYCYADPSKKDLFGVPDVNVAKNVSVVVATCCGLSELYESVMSRGHFGLIIVDEAAQATEPETMCALLFASPVTKVLLSGDPFQLGPSVRSQLAIRLGLETSMMKRLLKSAPYSEVTPSIGEPACDGPSRDHDIAVSSTFAVRLCKNYRSHGGLLEVPSQLFYNNELEACVDPAQVSYMENWGELTRDDGGVLDARWDLISPLEKKAEELDAFEVTRKGRTGSFPLVFVGVNGKQDNTVDSPSFFNRAEAVKVCAVVHALVTTNNIPGVTTRSIGILTPYRQQVTLIRRMLREAGYGAVNVGTVSDYQGQERDIIIVSAVVTEHVATHVHRNVGFMGNPGQFNVATTRGRALVICIGNPNYLAGDQHWRHLLQTCVKEGSYRGCPCVALGVHEDYEEEDFLDASLVDRVRSKIRSDTRTLGVGNLDELFPNENAQLCSFNSEMSWSL